MKLNPLKCAFKVSWTKFLGFMVTQRGIEANLIQLKAIMDSQAPTSRKGVQQLTSRLAALERFISSFTDRLNPFFITLRGAKSLAPQIPGVDSFFWLLIKFIATKESLS